MLFPLVVLGRSDPKEPDESDGDSRADSVSPEEPFAGKFSCSQLIHLPWSFVTSREGRGKVLEVNDIIRAVFLICRNIDLGRANSRVLMATAITVTVTRSKKMKVCLQLVQHR